MTKLLTTGEVARLCGFSASAVLQWLRAGKLPSYSSPGGQHRVDPEDLLAFLRVHGMRVPAELESFAAPKILIVDGREAAADLLRGILRSADLACEVEVAPSAVLGCMRLATLRPDLVVLDIAMTEVDAVELCRSARSAEELADTRILVLTDRPDAPRVQAALAAGADAWLAKPVRAEPFLASVHELLGIPVPEAPAQPSRRRAASGIGPQPAAALPEQSQALP